ncbi:hypothetical protein LVY72_15775 [Arthrobacter sp. I2-34]|uniref:Thiamine pyrophosphate enzyme TPP-binding domain-containing protein n=1 Tax=Arthrobacter hankyongi TaxID=2904801 RepID=A0ABS9L9J1_9MICC|nr:hypothetical protein [Arthrobacter hankyongi]
MAEVTWEQREMEAEPRFPDSQALPDFSYADYGRLLGLDGMSVEEPGELGEAWEWALAADRPFVLEAVTDPDIPLLPPFPAGAEKAGSMRRGSTPKALRAGTRASCWSGTLRWKKSWRRSCRTSPTRRANPAL